MAASSRDLSDDENARARAALEELRTARGITTDKALADLIGKTQPSVHKIRRGTQGIGYQLAQRIAELLGRDVDRMLGREKRRPEIDEPYEAVIDAAVLELASRREPDILPEDVAVARRELWNMNPTVDDAMGRILKAASDRRAAPKAAGEPLATLRERVWIAMHSLPRVGGKWPTTTQIAAGHLAAKDIKRELDNVLSGARLGFSAKWLEPIAVALAAEPSWLTDGKGEPPRRADPTTPIPPLPPPKHAQTSWTDLGDPDTIVKGRDTWQAALNAGFGELLTPSAVEKIKAEYFDPKRPGARTLDEWQKIFHQATTEPGNRRKPGSRKKKRRTGTSGGTGRLASGGE